MIDSDTVDIGAPPPAKPKQKPKPKRKGPYRRHADEKPPEFLGLGNRPGECCDECSDRGCYITRQGSGICAHPRGTGIQAEDMRRPAVADRYRRAKKYLDQMRLEGRD